MHEAESATWLIWLGLALALLAITGKLSLKLKLSTAPGYLIGGVLLGAWLDIPKSGLQALTLLGAMVILFFVGLQFSPRSLGPRLKNLAIPASIDFVINVFPIMFIAIWAMPNWQAGILFGIASYATSSAIVAKGLIDQKILVMPEAELTLGILVIEDLVMAFLLPVAAFTLQVGLMPWDSFALQILYAIAFVLLTVGFALLLQKQISTWISHSEKDLTLLTSLSVLCLIAGVGESSGVSAAVGALLAGMAVAESSHKGKVEELLLPHRELLAVGFFASIGAAGDWRLILEHLPWACAFALLAMIAKLYSGYLAGKQQGFTSESSFRTGILLTPRGEFSLVVASLAVYQPWGYDFYNLMVSYVVVSAIAGTVAIRYNTALSTWLTSKFAGAS